jgi:hypothetical protein
MADDPQTDWIAVARALLGSWPERVGMWGEDGIAAFIEELQARGVTTGAALAAIRSCDEHQRFPPSAPELAALARRDPSAPTFAESYNAIYGPRGVLRARPPYQDGGWSGNELQAASDELALKRADQCHQLLGAFVRAYGLERLRLLEVDDPDYGEIRRKELRADFEQYVAANEHRELAALAAGRRGSLGRLDPHAALGLRPRTQIPVPHPPQPVNPLTPKEAPTDERRSEHETSRRNPV